MAHYIAMRLLIVRILFIAVGLMASFTWADDDNRWQAPPSTIGDWFDPANWTLHVPIADETLTFIDNGGTARIVAGSAVANELLVGSANTGRLIIDSGRLDLTSALVLGNAQTGFGSVDIHGGTVKSTTIGVGSFLGAGNISQVGGNVDTIELQLGGGKGFGWVGEPEDFGRGAYNLIGGNLNANSLIVGDSGVGTFVQDGGIVASQSVVIGGQVGAQSFPIGNPIPSPIVPAQPLPTGLSSLATAGIAIPSLRSSTITDVWIVPPTPSIGAYNMKGGELTSRNLLVNRTGTFTQTAGRHVEQFIQINDGGRFNLYGGTLQVGLGMNVDGTFDFGHSNASLTAGSAILDFSHGLTAAEHAHVEAGPDSLTIFPAGFRPRRDLGSYHTQGITHFAGSDLILRSNQTVRGVGTIDDHVIVTGKLFANDKDGHGGINMNGGLELRPGATVDLASGEIFVRDNRTLFTGGNLKAGALNVTGTVEYPPPIVSPDPTDTIIVFQTPTIIPGTARQFGGSVDLGTLDITAGRYVLDAGEVSVGRIDIGASPFSSPPLASSTFVQNGGHVHAQYVSLLPAYFAVTQTTDDVTLNAVSAATPIQNQMQRVPHDVSPQSTIESYEMRAGSLSTDFIAVSGDFTSTPVRFHQTGGSVDVKRTVEILGSSSEYSISGGRLEARRLEVGFRYGFLSTYPQQLGSFSIIDRHADINFRGEMMLGGGGRFNAVPGSTIHFSKVEALDDWLPLPGDKVTIVSTDADALSGLANVKLLFEGGLDQSATLEAASNDLGAGAAGYLHNFAIGTLQVGGENPAALSLVDLIDNARNGSNNEAVYVDRLIVRPGSTLDLAGHHLYYHSGSFAPGSITGGSLLLAEIPEPSAVMLALLAILASPFIRRQ